MEIPTMADKVEQFEHEVQEEVTRLLNKVSSTSPLLYIKRVTMPGVCAPHLALVDDSLLNERNQNGDTALHIAAIRGHDKALTQLKEWGATSGGRGHRLRTPLHHAAAHGHLEIVRILVNAVTQGTHKLNLDARDIDGATALALAVAERDLAVHRDGKPSYKSLGHWDIISMLIENKACIDTSDEYGDTPIVRAAKTEQWELVKMLLLKGASPAICSKPEESVFALAAKGGREKLLQELLRREGVVNTAQAKSALKMAQSAAVVWVLIDAVPDAVMGKSGEGALRSAAADGREDALVALLQAGVDAGARGALAETALDLARAHGHAGCVRRLQGDETQGTSGVRHTCV